MMGLVFRRGELVQDRGEGRDYRTIFATETWASLRMAARSACPFLSDAGQFWLHRRSSVRKMHRFWKWSSFALESKVQVGRAAGRDERSTAETIEL